MKTITKKHKLTGDFIANTETTLTLHENHISGVTRTLPGFMYWDMPETPTLREWADELLADTGYKREGVIKFIKSDRPTRWYFQYKITKR